MKVSYQWLKEFVDLEASPRKLADDLSMVGIVAETVVDRASTVAGMFRRWPHRMMPAMQPRPVAS